MRILKVLFVLLSVFFLNCVSDVLSEESESKVALLLIDIQEFYFPGGFSELENAEEASLNAKKLLKHFRDKEQLVVHVKHKVDEGGDIHKNVEPKDDEEVFEKKDVNSFCDPKLHKYFQDNDIKKLVICGMQTHMCLEAAARAAFDLDYECSIIHDACATKDIKFNGKKISATDVHNSTFATLEMYAGAKDDSEVTDTESYISATNSY